MPGTRSQRQSCSSGQCCPSSLAHPSHGFAKACPSRGNSVGGCGGGGALVQRGGFPGEGKKGEGFALAKGRRPCPPPPIPPLPPLPATPCLGTPGASQPPGLSGPTPG